MDYVKGKLGKDTDGYFYVDYVSSVQEELDDPDYGYVSYLMQLANIITRGIESKKPDILVKYGWLKEKYNEVIRNIHGNITSLTGELREMYGQLNEV